MYDIPFILVFQERDFRITLEESQKIERRYKAFFDLTIVNDNIDETFNRLRKAIETLSTEPQWVPVSWVYWDTTDIVERSLWDREVGEEYGKETVRGYRTVSLYYPSWPFNDLALNWTSLTLNVCMEIIDLIRVRL